MKKCVVYTAIFGNRDVLRDPEQVHADMDYICYTDNPAALSTTVWNVIPSEMVFENTVKTARWFKLHPHLLFPTYDTSVWIDANFTPQGDISSSIQNYLAQHPVAVFTHPIRDCIYEEAQVVINSMPALASIIEPQMYFYRETGYPEHQGLVASGVLFRRHHQPEVIYLMEQWWHHIVVFSGRDQLSFNYVAWKHNSCYTLIKQSIFAHPHFHTRDHGVR
ncbi:glycosyltransferase domain-containing protein [Paenibacillus taiwanensis]|uniref:glycosyltransferase domain-containing protein n=1 Tax=Paenibacillus taiwanensis TaxID=401638 RepID=UPI00041A7B0B|nr:glycosyltransferase domain-containing protein [Paenibacillus taiwanensis]